MYLLLDIGGTNTRIGLSFDRENLSRVKIFPTPKKYEGALEIISGYLESVKPTSDKRVVCAGLPGVFDRNKTKLLTAPNLSGWVGKPIRDDLSKIITTDEVFLENDADLAGLGEAVFGAGRGYKIVAFITIGTGVGGVRIVDGQIDKSVWGFEPGHQIFEISENRGLFYKEWEEMISGKAIERQYAKAPEKIDDVDFWRKVEKYIAAGVNNAVVFWSPDIVILGGGLMKSQKISVKGIRSKLDEILEVFPQKPEIVKGKLGDRAGLLGSLYYIKQKGF